MTPFWRGLKNIWSGANHEKIEKVTGSPDAVSSTVQWRITITVLSNEEISLYRTFPSWRPLCSAPLAMPVESGLHDLAPHAVPGYTIHVLELKAQ